MKKISLVLIIITLMLSLAGCRDKEYTVTFDTDGGEVIAPLTVTAGESVSAMPTPEKEGYAFLGWFDETQTEYTNQTLIEKSLTLHARWEILEFTVTFKAFDGTVMETQEVAYETAAIAPEPAAVLGHAFSGWDQDFSEVKSDLTVTALYLINVYEVTFLDHDETVLKTETVEYGADATPPTDPVREGYFFRGWNQDFQDVTRDLTVLTLYDQDDLGVIYVLEGDAYTASGYDGTNPAVVILGTYNGLPVTAIGDGAFLNNYDITSVSLPEGITAIGNQAFSGCAYMTSVNIPVSVQTIGTEAFNACTMLSSIVIPTPVIGEAAFSGCTGMTSITLESTVTSIGAWGFWGNSKLLTIFVPQSVTTLGKHVFSWCQKLNYIYTPSANLSNLSTMLLACENIYVHYAVVGQD